MHNGRLNRKENQCEAYEITSLIPHYNLPARLNCDRVQYTVVSTKVVQESVKAYATMPKGSLGNTQ